jgi:hypothetical protein
MKLKHFFYLDIMQLEEWRVIEGYENYEISSFGRVRNIKTRRYL